METIIRALRVSTPRLLELPNVVGVGGGCKHVRGQCTGRPTVTVLVRKKVPRRELQSYHVVPKTIGEAYTDVIEVGDIVALSRTAKMRPAQPGISIGHFNITAGTFGAVVYDEKTGEPLILSNNHVLADSTNGKDGRAKVGDAILQPGKYDKGTADDMIARLYRFAPIYPEVSAPQCQVAASIEKMLNSVIRRFRRNYHVKLYTVTSSGNLVDAAVARPVAPDLVKPEILDIGVPRGVAEASVGDRVVKSGRTSGTNWGTVKVIKTTVKVGMGDVGDAVFTDQVVTTHMAEPGDSGSLVLNKDYQAVGLLSAGSDSVSIFSRIQNVCDALGVRMEP